MTSSRLSFRMFLYRVLPLLILVLAARAAIAQTDPPARVGSLSRVEGSVVIAPAGETEWSDAPLNRPTTSGDRIWTDRDARAELHLGSAVVHIDSQAFLDLVALDEAQFQASLNEGSVNVRVRELEATENFEIDTPHLAFRAAQPGNYRIDVDPAGGTTRVAVRSGLAQVYGAGGQALQLQAGQQLSFAGRELEPVASAGRLAEDSFDRWAADRNRMEDQSISARYLPRDVVGYAQLDLNGTWAQDPGYGAVWFPRVQEADWAPYRYGRWESIAPWGWTWIDDAPWGFAPFHYGRWALIGSRWAWVPGRLGPRPVYAPALVAFIGSGAHDYPVGSGRGIGWYPLAPGEAWRPSYHASPAYLRNINRFIGSGSGVHLHQRRPETTTAVRIDDFSRGRPVHRQWRRLQPADLANAQVIAPPAVSGARRWGEAGRSGNLRVQPPPVQQPDGAVREQQVGQDRFQHEQQAQRALRAQQMQQPSVQLEQQAAQARNQQLQHQRHEREQQARQQQAAAEQFQRRQDWQQQRAAPQQAPAPSPRPQRVRPAPDPMPLAQRAPGRGRSDDNGGAGAQAGEERGSVDEGGRGRGRGHRGRFN